MSWRIQDEVLDVDQEMYHIQFVNDDVLNSDGTPKTFHRIIFLRRETCAACGHIQTDKNERPSAIDIQKIRAETHTMLEQHHQEMLGMARKYRARVLSAKKAGA